MDVLPCSGTGVDCNTTKNPSMQAARGSPVLRERSGLQQGCVLQRRAAWQLSCSSRREWIATTSARRSGTSKWFSRPSGREWIATMRRRAAFRCSMGSPVLRDGSGLQLDAERVSVHHQRVLPFSGTGVDGNGIAATSVTGKPSSSVLRDGGGLQRDHGRHPGGRHIGPPVLWDGSGLQQVSPHLRGGVGAGSPFLWDGSGLQRGGGQRQRLTVAGSPVLRGGSGLRRRAAGAAAPHQQVLPSSRAEVDCNMHRFIVEGDTARFSRPSGRE